MTVPALAQAYVDSPFFLFVDNGRAPRSNYGVPQFDRQKLGIVDHIPVCEDLEANLTPYFNGGNARGASHLGTGRKFAGWLDWQGFRIPVALTHQYMPIVGPYSPWAQGVTAWRNNPNCDTAIPQHLLQMPTIWANPAYVSFENVAWSGADGMTDPQFNARVLGGAYCAGFFGFEINEATHLRHAHFNPIDRCFDPGWDSRLFDAVLNATRGVMVGDPSGLRGVEGLPQEEDLKLYDFRNTTDPSGLPWTHERIRDRRLFAINNALNVVLRADSDDDFGRELNDFDAALLEDVLARRKQ